MAELCRNITLRKRTQHYFDNTVFHSSIHMFINGFNVLNRSLRFECGTVSYDRVKNIPYFETY